MNSGTGTLKRTEGIVDPSETGRPSHLISIFGITGRVGQAIARQAVSRGWIVHGYVRPPTPLPTSFCQYHIIEGEMDDRRMVTTALEGADAVYCLLGPRPPYSDIFCARAMAAIVDGMHEVGSKRLLCLTGAMIGSYPNRSPLFETMAKLFSRKQRRSAGDRADQEQVVRDSGLDWTIVKPPRLTMASSGRKVKSGVSLRVGLTSSIGREDLATFMLDEHDRPHYVHKAVFVKT